MIVVGDCVEEMAKLPPASVDAIVTDPPYGLEFMGKDWDRFADAPRMTATQKADHMNTSDSHGPWGRRARPIMPNDYGHRNERCLGCGKWRVSSNRCECAEPQWEYRIRQAAPPSMLAFQAWSTEWAREALRVLKPGGYMIAAGGSRTYHRLVCAIEDAGFEIRDCITHLYGSGFPKSLNVSEALRKLPACACDVASEVGAVDAVAPSSAVGARVRAEAGAVGAAGISANGAGGVGPQSGAGAASAGPDMQLGVEQGSGDGTPIVLGPGTVAGVAAGNEVRADVGSVEADPEALRDEVVRDAGDPVAIDAGTAGDHIGADAEPADSLVLPLSAAPRGVAGIRRTGCDRRRSCMPGRSRSECGCRDCRPGCRRTRRRRQLAWAAVWLVWRRSAPSDPRGNRDCAEACRRVLDGGA